MTEAARHRAEEPPVKWLAPAEVDSWLALVRLMTWLPLTEKGLQTLVEAAPGHVADVRSLVIDVLSPEQLRRLGRDADRIMSHIDTSAIN